MRIAQLQTVNSERDIGHLELTHIVAAVAIRRIAVVAGLADLDHIVGAHRSTANRSAIIVSVDAEANRAAPVVWDAWLNQNYRLEINRELRDDWGDGHPIDFGGGLNVPFQ